MRFPLTSILAGLVAVGATLAAVRSAAACTPVGREVKIEPAAGPSGVWRDGAILIHQARRSATVSLREQGTGSAVESQTTIVGSGSYPTLVVRPQQPLAAQTSYDVFVTEPAPDGTVQASFTTGAELAVVPASFAGLTGLRLDSMEISTDVVNRCGGTCLVPSVDPSGDRYGRVVLEYPSVPAGTELLLLELRGPKGEPEGNFVLRKATRVSPWDHELAGAFPWADVGGEHCARLTAYDARGAVVPGGEEVCAVALDNEPLFDEGCLPQFGTPRDTGCAIGSPGRRVATTGLLLTLGAAVLARRRRRR